MENERKREKREMLDHIQNRINLKHGKEDAKQYSNMDGNENSANEKNWNGMLRTIGAYANKSISDTETQT